MSHPLLQELAAKYPYMTRLNTVISPEEMTVDPIFDYDAQRKDVSNVHDLSGWTGLYDCQRAQSINISTSDRRDNAMVGSIGLIKTSTTINRVIPPDPELSGPVTGADSSSRTTKPSYFWTIFAAGAVGGFLVLLMGGSVLAAVALTRDNIT